MKKIFLSVAILPALSMAHDIWIEPSVSVLKVGSSVDLSLMLGNHGNSHRDFKLASKVANEDRMLHVVTPDSSVEVVTESLKSHGPSETDGFWRAEYTPKKEGLYCAFSIFDKVMSYGPVRDIKLARTYFVVGKAAAWSEPKSTWTGLELVPITNPADVLQNGGNFRVRLLYKGKPLAATLVSFIPRGIELEGKVDARYQVATDDHGVASLSLTTGNDYLIAAHVEDLDAKGEGYVSINYAATIYLSIRP